jgi:uncharacterized repeat protein (TIGR01451 family)
MKRITQITFVLTLFVPVLMAQPQKGIDLKFPQYKVTLPATLEGNADRDMIPFIDGKLDRLPKKSEQSRFGIFYKQFSNALATTPVLEIIDGGNDQVIKSVTLDEYYGKETASWKRIPAELKSSPTSIVTAYAVRQGSYDLKVVRSITVADAKELPTGKSLKLNFSVQSKTPLTLKVRFLGSAVGSMSLAGTTLAIISNDTLPGLTPALVLRADPTASIKIGDAPQQFSVLTGPVELKANQLSPVLNLTIAGTSTGFKAHIKEQVGALQEFFNNGTVAPNLVATIVPNKMSGSPGDTIIYTIYYHNIGTAPAVDVKLSNPVPAGARYIEGSATGVGSDFSFKRFPSTPPNVSEISEITWSLKNNIPPGQERSASYKVILK